MPPFYKLPSWWLDILLARLATHMARQGDTGLGEALLDCDTRAKPDMRLPFRVRVSLSAAVGWQEGLRGMSRPSQAPQ